MQLGGFLGRLFQPLLKSCWPLMKNVLKALAKNVGDYTENFKRRNG